MKTSIACDACGHVERMSSMTMLVLVLMGQIGRGKLNGTTVGRWTHHQPNDDGGDDAWTAPPRLRR